MAIKTFGDTLMSYIPGTGCIYNIRELTSDFTRELVLGPDVDGPLDNLTLVNWAEKNHNLDLEDRLDDQNSRPLGYTSETCCFGPTRYFYI